MTIEKRGGIAFTERNIRFFGIERAKSLMKQRESRGRDAQWGGEFPPP
jgi:hypothetical protein